MTRRGLGQRLRQKTGGLEGWLAGGPGIRLDNN